MGKPPVKSAKRLIKAELQAKAEWKRSKAGWESSLRDHIGLGIDRIDPLELAATLSMTFTVYDIIKSVPELMVAATNSFRVTEQKLLLGVFYPLFEELYNRVFQKEELTTEQKAALQKIRDTPDTLLFIKCFAIAYVIIKHAGQIIAGVGNIAGFVGSFLGLKVVA